MRIGIVVAPFYPVPPKTYGPVEYQVSELIKGLTELGHEVVLFASGDSSVDCELVPICPRAYPVCSDYDLDLKFWKLRRRAEEKTLEMLKKHISRLDVLHSWEVDLLPLADFPSVTTMSGPFNLYNVDYFWERKEKLFFVNISNAQKRGLSWINYLGMIYYGLDPSKFEFNEKPQDYLSFVGRISKEKGAHNAVELSLKKKMYLKMGGTVMYFEKSYFHETIKPYLQDPNLEFLDEVDLKEKNQLFKNARCNLHLINFRESFGLTVLESAYCGTPTLAIRLGSMPEVIENGKSGILVEDVLEAYFRLEETFSLDRRYIATRARQFFNYRIMSRQYVLAYRKVMDLYKRGLQKNKGMLDAYLKTSQKDIFQIWEKAARPEIKTRPEVKLDFLKT